MGYISTDVAYEIAKNLAGEYYSSERQDLFSMSLSCRDFRDPCLNILWKMYSIAPLLKLLPAAKEGNPVCFPIILE